MIPREWPVGFDDVAVIDEATVGERVAFYRRRRGITQEVLAGLLGRSVEWLAQFERGARELDRLSTTVAIAHALGIEPVKLLPAAFFSHRLELHDIVLGTAPDSVPAIKSAMFRYNGMARLLAVPDRAPVDIMSCVVALARHLATHRPSGGRRLARYCRT